MSCPGRQGSWTYDKNRDGVFNVQDYAGDSRVGDRNGNGLLDPQDLIKAFSDGRDGDHNGYVDDISGWDFAEDDNDPADLVRYGHGTGESEDSSAEANNGRAASEAARTACSSRSGSATASWRT